MTADTTQAINRTTEPKEVTVVDRAQRCALMLRQGHILPKLKLAELLEDLAQAIIDKDALNKAITIPHEVVVFRKPVIEREEWANRGLYSELRQKHNISLMKIALAAYMSKTAVDGYFKGKKTTQTTIKRLEDAVNALVKEKIIEG